MELKRVIQVKKEKYKTKIEQKFTQNNMKRVWEGMRLMSGYSKNSSSKNCLPDTSVEYAEKLNEFCNRFYKHDFGAEICDLRNTPENNLKSENESFFYKCLNKKSVASSKNLT